MSFSNRTGRPVRKPKKRDGGVNSVADDAAPLKVPLEDATDGRSRGPAGSTVSEMQEANPLQRPGLAGCFL